MKPLTEYRKNGYDFSLFKRDGDVAIFRGVKDSSPSTNWEVVCIQKNPGGARIFHTPEKEVIEVMFEPKEYPPSDNDWGAKGWTCLTQEDAEAKMQLLLATTKSAK